MAAVQGKVQREYSPADIHRCEKAVTSVSWISVWAALRSPAFLCSLFAFFICRDENSAVTALSEFHAPE